MGADSGDLDSWRIFFRTTGTNIFDVINNGIVVAAQDHPLDLKLRRDQIVHLLYHHCCPCNPIEMSIPLQKKRVFQRGVETENPSRRKKLDGGHSEADGPDVPNGRLHHEDLPNSREKGKSNGETKIADHPHNINGKDEEMEAEFEEGEMCEIENIHQAKVANPTQRVGGKGGETEDADDERRKISDCHRETEAEFEEGEILYIGNIHETEVANPTQLVGGKGEEMEAIKDEHRKRRDYHREMEVEFEEGEIREVEDIDETEVANPIQLMGGKCEEMEVVNDEQRKIRDYHREMHAEFEEGEIRDVEDIDEREVANPIQLVDGKGEEMNAVNDEEWKIRDYHREQIEESMQAKSMASDDNDGPKVLDSNVVSSGKDDALQESLSEKTADGSDCVDNRGSNKNQMGRFVEQQAKACKELDGEGDETFEEVSRIKRVLDDSNLDDPRAADEASGVGYKHGDSAGSTAFTV
ncbi:hypothetical protein Cgig2_012567 [Carnegiea gigantea]|uniref:Uncharacterized protein n=1 Tax=Carnegiea gigantea TaxID=171969 RepID=A0A9Q1K1J1_9CARY|nr:hypothetical protein Cgig2_012567 [Carnegiea gigantea]